MGEEQAFSMGIWLFMELLLPLLLLHSVVAFADFCALELKLAMQMVTLEGLTNLQVLEKGVNTFPQEKRGEF